MYRYFNPNPFLNNNTGDCVVRGICMLTGDDWDTVYIHIIVEGYRMKMMPSDNLYGVHILNILDILDILYQKNVLYVIH